MKIKMQLLQLFFSLYCFILFTVTFQLINAASISKIEDAAYWRNIGKSHLEKVLKRLQSTNNLKAKNVILFVGDGMGMTSVSAGRIYKGQLKGQTGEEETLVFEDFPNTGMSKTYNVDKQVPDSAGTATAMFTGVKTRYAVIGMDATLTKTDSERGKLTSIMDWAQKSGKRTGIVTTTRITHATPSSAYANIYNRDWECDSEIPKESLGIYKDIARQLVEDEPGRNLNVILGGGLSPMGDLNLNEKATIKFQGSTETICTRTDGRNLTDEWLKIDENYEKSNMINSTMESIKKIRKLVKTRDDLMNLNTSEIDHLLGLFRNNHITYSIARQPGEPSLSEMTQQAIRVLDRGDKSKGFILMVEGGRIDQAHHQNYARAAMREIIEMDDAIEVALNMTKRSETLIIVTADHSHSLTFNGYPKRGSDILGFANKSSSVLPYETLTYANGPGYWDHLDNNTQDSSSSSSHYGSFVDILQFNEKRLEPTYRHLATLGLEDETHGGEDVGVYATGPGSELIRGTFEQNYIAYAISYAGCIGPAKDMNLKCKYDDTSDLTSNGNSYIINNNMNLLTKIVIFTLVIITINNQRFI